MGNKQAPGLGGRPLSLTSKSSGALPSARLTIRAQTQDTPTTQDSTTTATSTSVSVTLNSSIKAEENDLDTDDEPIRLTRAISVGSALLTPESRARMLQMSQTQNVIEKSVLVRSPLDPSVLLPCNSLNLDELSQILVQWQNHSQTSNHSKNESLKLKFKRLRSNTSVTGVKAPRFYESRLTAVPESIYIHILCFLDIREVVLLSRSSRFLYICGQSKPLWRALVRRDLRKYVAKKRKHEYEKNEKNNSNNNTNNSTTTTTTTSTAVSNNEPPSLSPTTATTTTISMDHGQQESISGSGVDEEIKQLFLEAQQIETDNAAASTSTATATSNTSSQYRHSHRNALNKSPFNAATRGRAQTSPILAWVDNEGGPPHLSLGDRKRNDVSSGLTSTTASTNHSNNQLNGGSPHLNGTTTNGPNANGSANSDNSTKNEIREFEHRFLRVQLSDLEGKHPRIVYQMLFKEKVEKKKIVEAKKQREHLIKSLRQAGLY